MSQFYPGRIRAVMRGEEPKVQVGYSIKKQERENGDKWVDKDGKHWEKVNGITKSIPKLQDARIPLFCPKCKRVMKAKIDTEFYLNEQMCHKCVTERDTDLIISGKFENFQKKKVLIKKQGFLLEGKDSISEYLKKIDDGIQIVNEDGKIEEWSGDTEKMKIFLNKELDDINKNLAYIENHLGKVQELDNEETTA